MYRFQKIKHPRKYCLWLGYLFLYAGRLRSYDFVRPLKSNRVSTVWLVQSKIHKTFCALKLTRKLVASRNNVVHLPTNEQSILGSINHNLISNIIEAFQDISNLYIVLEYMPCGSLREYLTYSGCLTESQTRIYKFIKVSSSSVCSLHLTIYTSDKLHT